MSNVQWRIFRGQSLALIEQMQEHNLPHAFKSELDRITSLLNHEDELYSYPKIFTEAEPVELCLLPSSVAQQYEFLLKNAKKFSVIQ
tara:strand:+ start:7041 stop:7301 length:261 start_codon:yes stop_codon:yes gene_type:complete